MCWIATSWETRTVNKCSQVVIMAYQEINGRERVATVNDWAAFLGISASTIHTRLRNRMQIGRVLSPYNMRGKNNKRASCLLDRGDWFDRRKHCIKDSVNCSRYGECQDARIIQGEDKWQKPGRDCYSPEESRINAYAGYRSCTESVHQVVMPR